MYRIESKNAITGFRWRAENSSSSMTELIDSANLQNSNYRIFNSLGKIVWVRHSNPLEIGNQIVEAIISQQEQPAIYLNSPSRWSTQWAFGHKLTVDLNIDWADMLRTCRADKRLQTVGSGPEMTIHIVL